MEILLIYCEFISYKCIQFDSTWSFLSLPQEPSGTDRDYFWLRPILSSSLPSPIRRLAHVGSGGYWSLMPSGQLFRVVCAWHSRGLPGWLTPQLSPHCAGPGRGGSAVCSCAPNQRVASPHLAVSHAAWTGKQLWAAKFNHSHFREWDAGRFWEWKLGIYFVFLSYFSSDVWIDWVKSWLNYFLLGVWSWESDFTTLSPSPLPLPIKW